MEQVLMESSWQHEIMAAEGAKDGFRAGPKQA